MISGRQEYRKTITPKGSLPGRVDVGSMGSLHLPSSRVRARLGLSSSVGSLAP